MFPLDEKKLLQEIYYSYYQPMLLIKKAIQFYVENGKDIENLDTALGGLVESRASIERDLGSIN